MMATALKLSSALKVNPLGLTGCAAVAGMAFVAIGLLRWPLVAVLLLLGGVAVGAAWKKLPR
jgi:chromate transporter